VSTLITCDPQHHPPQRKTATDFFSQQSILHFSTKCGHLQFPISSIIELVFNPNFELSVALSKTGIFIINEHLQHQGSLEAFAVSSPLSFHETDFFSRQSVTTV